MDPVAPKPHSVKSLDSPQLAQLQHGGFLFSEMGTLNPDSIRSIAHLCDDELSFERVLAEYDANDVSVLSPENQKAVNEYKEQRKNSPLNLKVTDNRDAELQSEAQRKFESVHPRTSFQHRTFGENSNAAPMLSSTPQNHLRSPISADKNAVRRPLPDGEIKKSVAANIHSVPKGHSTRHYIPVGILTGLVVSSLIVAAYYAVAESKMTESAQLKHINELRRLHTLRNGWDGRPNDGLLQVE